MNKKDKLRKLKREAADELPNFLAALQAIKRMDGISIRADDALLKAVKKALDFTPSTKEGRELKKNMIFEAKVKAHAGLFGDGLFLID